MINDLFIQWFGSPSSCWAQTETLCGLAVEPASPLLRVRTLPWKLTWSPPIPPSASCQRLQVLPFLFTFTLGWPLEAPQVQLFNLRAVDRWLGTEFYEEVISDESYAKTKKGSPQQNLLVSLFSLTDIMCPTPPSSQGHGDTRRKCNSHYKKSLAWKWTHALPRGINASFSQDATRNTLLKEFLIFPRSVF